MNQNNALRYPLTQGRFINRFLQTALFETPEHFQKTTMTGKINQWLQEKGFSHQAGIELVVMEEPPSLGQMKMAEAFGSVNA